MLGIFLKSCYNTYRNGDNMKEIKENDIIEAIVTGIQNYGAFAKIENEYDGLIHISEISYGYVRNVNDFIKIGDKIHAKVIGIDEDTGKVKLSIKDLDYKHDGKIIVKNKIPKNGFEPLREHLDEWINEKIREIMNKM